VNRQAECRDLGLLTDRQSASGKGGHRIAPGSARCADFDDFAALVRYDSNDPLNGFSPWATAPAREHKQITPSVNARALGYRLVLHNWTCIANLRKLPIDLPSNAINLS
jgi:hypothetical protein